MTQKAGVHSRPTRAARSRPAKNDAPESPLGIQSVVRALSILECIGQSTNGIGLVELSKSVELHSSTTFNLVKTMVRLGYIRQSEADRSYHLGGALLKLAANASDEVGLINLANDALQELSLRTGESGHFAVWSSGEVSILAKTNGSGAFQLSDRLSGSRPAHATALGKILLSALSAGQLDEFLRKPLAKVTSRTIVNPEVLRTEIAKVAKAKIAFDDAEFHEEVRCAAVPVFSFAGRIVGAMGLSGPIWRMSIQTLQDKSDELKKAAAKLSAELGYKPGKKS